MVIMVVFSWNWVALRCTKGAHRTGRGRREGREGMGVHWLPLLLYHHRSRSRSLSQTDQGESRLLLPRHV